MTFFSSFFKNFLTSLIITSLFALIGVSLFVGDFPPKVSQIKSVFAEYKNMLLIKQQILEKNKNLSAEELVVQMQTGPQEQLRKLANARKANAEAADKLLEEHDQTFAAEKPVAVPVEVKAVDIPKAWQEQFYHLKAEVFRLNQRVAELERQRIPAAAAQASPQK